MPGGRRGFQHSAAASRWHLSHVLDPVAKSERRRAAASRGPAGAEAQVTSALIARSTISSVPIGLAGTAWLAQPVPRRPPVSNRRSLGQSIRLAIPSPDQNWRPRRRLIERQGAVACPFQSGNQRAGNGRSAAQRPSGILPANRRQERRQRTAVRQLAEQRVHARERVGDAPERRRLSRCAKV